MQSHEQEPTPLERYFTALDTHEFEAALATLSDSCVYIRPPVRPAVGPHSNALEAHVGKESVRAFLEARGRLAISHDIHASESAPGQCFVMGTATSLGAGERTLFMAHALVDEAGSITRFIAVSSPLDPAATEWIVRSR